MSTIGLDAIAIYSAIITALHLGAIPIYSSAMVHPRRKKENQEN
jgi:hypothetical protein